MVIWISIYFIGVFVCGLVQLYTQHLRLVGVDRRRWHHPPPERSRNGRVSQTAVRRDALFAFSG